MQINIIDPSSTEFNRGSFCYAPYLIYNGLMETGNDVTLLETFIPEDLDTIPDADQHIVTLWSYPQIETSLLLAHFLPFIHGKDNVYFAGYAPLIKQLGLKHVSRLLGFDPLTDETFLKQAMKSYPKYFSHFKRLLLSDCDMHLQSLEVGQLVYPMFTTYGCPSGCSFCPSTINCNKARIILTEEQVFSMLFKAVGKGVKAIHFTDEDFFYDIGRAKRILLFLSTTLLTAPNKMRLIALGSAGVVRLFIETYGISVLESAGMEIIEIGFESGSAELSKKMGKGKSLTDCEWLATNTPGINIFWLVQTFFPGETIGSLNATGYFMNRHGFAQDEVVGRLRTNGTKGGLGQFFQPYDGTALYNTLKRNGIFLTDRPVRLMPSYLPNSFLDSKIVSLNLANIDMAVEWLVLYNVYDNIYNTINLEVGKSMRDYIENHPVYVQGKIAIMMAILARMQVIL